MAGLEWKGLTYTIKTKSVKDKMEERVILNNITGSAKQGQLLAIMGPSGSGKTSLLNALAGRIPVTKGASLTGEVYVDGVAMSAAGDMAEKSAYIMQDDALFALSTVQETLMFAARLRLPAAMSLADKEKRVTQVIEELGLVKARNTIIGNQKVRGLSGGERKRVNIGVDMLHDPKLLFVDEPTSGLDSFQAQSVMSTLSALSKKGRTVVCSIHQPRSSIYQMLDTVLLLSQGCPMYYGRAGPPVGRYFSDAGFPIPASFNPSDFLLDTISVDYRSEKLADSTKTIVDTLRRRYIDTRNPGDGTCDDRLTHDDEHKAQAEADKAAKAATVTHVGHVGEESHEGGVAGGSSFCLAFSLLAKRSWRELTRDKVTLCIKYAMNLFFTLMFGFVYFRMDFDQTSLQDRTGILFFQAMNQAFGASIGISQTIPLQLHVVSRERASKMYGSLSYYLATFVTVLPLEALPQLVWTIVLYFLTGLRPGSEFVMTFVGIMMLENFVAIGLGMILSAAFKSVEMAGQIAPAVVVLFLMFSGYFLNESSIPVWIGWIKYLSFIRYAFQALAVNEFKNATFTCTANQTMTGRCLQGDDMLKQLKFEDITIAGNVMYLVIILVAFNVLAFLVLYLNRPKFLRLEGLQNKGASSEHASHDQQVVDVVASGASAKVVDLGPTHSSTAVPEGGHVAAAVGLEIIASGDAGRSDEGGQKAEEMV